MKKGKLFYISTLALVVTLCSVAYFSYAFFIKDFEFNGKLNIVAGTIDYKITSTELDNNNSITIPANTEVRIDVDITSLNNIDSKYLMYYTTTDNTGLIIKYVNFKDSVLSNIEKGKKNSIILVATNSSDTSKQVTFNTIGGFKDSTLTITDGYEITAISSYNSNSVNYIAPTGVNCSDVQCMIEYINDLLTN